MNSAFVGQTSGKILKVDSDLLRLLDLGRLDSGWADGTQTRSAVIHRGRLQYPNLQEIFLQCLPLATCCKPSKHWALICCDWDYVAASWVWRLRCEGPMQWHGPARPSTR